MKPALLGVLLAATSLLAGCSYDPTQATFTENVGDAFAQCNPAEIRFLAAKHNFMTAFEPCGSNNFAHYAWSPSGTHLYFQLTHTAHIMDAGADTKDTITVPFTEAVVGPGTWLNNGRIAVPVAPVEDSDTLRIAVFDQDQKSVLYHPLVGYTEPADLHRGRSSSELFFTAMSKDGRGIFKMNVDDGSIDVGFPWAAEFTSRVATFSYTPGANAAVVGIDDTVTLYDSTDGTVLGSWSPAKRGTLHPKGRWLALEFEGEPQSIFFQRSWDELSERARERELARAEEFEERLPDWYPKEVNPPMVGLVDRKTGDRWMFTGFLGHGFQWYEPFDFYASFILWGFEGKELNRNVMLGGLNDRLRALEAGEEMLGMARWPGSGESNNTVPWVDPDPDGTEAETGSKHTEEGEKSSRAVKVKVEE